jgi:hypothetical protein
MPAHTCPERIPVLGNMASYWLWSSDSEEEAEEMPIAQEKQAIEQVPVPQVNVHDKRQYYSQEEDFVIMDEIKKHNRPRWKAVASRLKSMGFDRTVSSISQRARKLDMPVGSSAVHQLVKRALRKVRKLASNRTRGREWQKNNKEKSRARAKKYRNAHAGKAEFVQMRQKNTQRNRASAAAYEKNRLIQDPGFRAIKKLRLRLYGIIKMSHGIKKTGSATKAIGGSREKLVEHLSINLHTDERLNDLHIDHVFPLKCYDLSNEYQQRNAQHYSNTQALQANENLCKGAKLPTKAMAAKVDRDKWPPGITEDMLPDIYPGWATPLRMHAAPTPGASSSTDTTSVVDESMSSSESDSDDSDDSDNSDSD